MKDLLMQHLAEQAEKIGGPGSWELGVLPFFADVWDGTMVKHESFNGELSTQNCVIEISSIYKECTAVKMEMALDGMKLASFIVTVLVMLWLLFQKYQYQ